MAALFPPWSDSVYRLALGGVVAGAAGSLVGLMIYVRTPWKRYQFEPVDQPVQFDHRHHVRDDGIDCLYCHAGARKSAYAGIPAAEVCMGCHAQVWPDSVTCATFEPFGRWLWLSVQIITSSFGTPFSQRS